MKRLVAVTQRVVEAADVSERRDSLDQRWFPFLSRCHLLPLVLPNHLETAVALLTRFPVDGYLLTGGGDLVRYGGTSPERDEIEKFLLTESAKNGKPLLGVCRGMQAIQEANGTVLGPVQGHVTPHQEIRIDGKRESANSYHRLGTKEATKDFTVWAKADDGVVKAIRHQTRPWCGIMWHPERLNPFTERDIQMIGAFFSKAP